MTMMEFMDGWRMARGTATGKWPAALPFSGGGGGSLVVTLLHMAASTRIAHDLSTTFWCKQGQSQQAELCAALWGSSVSRALGVPGSEGD